MAPLRSPPKGDDAISTQETAPRPRRRTGRWLAPVPTVVAVLLAAAIVIGLNMGGRPGVSAQPSGSLSVSDTPTATELASPTATATTSPTRLPRRSRRASFGSDSMAHSSLGPASSA